MELERQRSQRALFNPLALWGEWIGSMPFRGMLQLAEASKSQQFRHCYGLFQQAIKALGPPAFDIEQVEFDGRKMPVEESVVAETEFCRLRSFSCMRDRTSKSARRVLLCAPLAGHHAMQLREVVQSLLPYADVYVSEWVDARDIPTTAGDFYLEDVVLTLQDFIVKLNPQGLDVLAICQATVPAIAAIALLVDSNYPEPRSLVLLGGPIDPRSNPTPLTGMARSLPLSWLDALGTHVVPAGYRGAGRRIYPGFLQYPSLIMAQPERQLFLLCEYMRSLGGSDTQAACDAERSIAHNGAMLDMPAEFILDTVRVVFQQTLLPRGMWRVAGRLVRPGQLCETRLLTIEGSRDTISGVGHTHAAQDLCVGVPGERRRRITIAGCDHYGLFGGPNWRAEVYPAVHDWLVG
ncbi:polyhydroxyalkanoate depolymerase [Cupriavidus oxalaticus]|uniref:Esterase n=1 Tax=Cupriavidus oxalaticus TaxID=96344 RepID=A0A375GPL7_9BURK|nr:polyhydroxyalkanoate depolymerase [Cupriavidus oxalaticus]QRQ85588.1 polyhydroxyalkanoate depolymerase [Cupriavidus oxalaticus]QRQ90324.1 polyhydroxyalkanoate depolymerase [Cupriavidus oxalaticus]WQD84836.1 polyhydroxyalkanoate depolymerase [Cupriavidus oxalaticus]SPC07742.1 Esterase [Cupriavidus oxalaticus]SPC24423.1 Esterase [Cupriavidus oxalaticus]